MKSLIEMYPDFLHCNIMSEVVKVEELILIEEEEAINNLVSEFFVDTAFYTLPIWAEFAGIDDDENLDLNIRRDNIKAAFKSIGVTTVDVIKKIAESYSNGKCEVVEYIGDYFFVIKFVSTIGIPKRIDLIKKLIDKVKPAHLGYRFEFKYRTWGDLKVTGMTYKLSKNKGFTGQLLRSGDISPYDINIIG